MAWSDAPGSVRGCPRSSGARCDVWPPVWPPGLSEVTAHLTHDRATTTRPLSSTVSDVLSVVNADGTTEASSVIDDIVRKGARRMPAAALEAEVNAYIAELADERDERGRRLVVRNGYHQPRDVTTAAGVVEVKAPRVNDKRIDEATGAPRRSCRRTDAAARREGRRPGALVFGATGAAPTWRQPFGGARAQLERQTRMTRHQARTPPSVTFRA